MAVLGSDILRKPTQLRSKLVLLSALITLGTAAVMAAMSGLDPVPRAFAISAPAFGTSKTRSNP